MLSNNMMLGGINNQESLANAGKKVASSTFWSDLGDFLGWGSARRQREWEEKMSNTAHQREMNDLSLAGLNATLGMGGQGASTPSGASAKGVSSEIIGGLTQIVNSATHLAESKRHHKEEEIGKGMKMLESAAKIIALVK